MSIAERISTGRAARICGLSAKTVRKLAADGTIPGAAVLGSVWRFDECRLRDWIRRREAEACRGRDAATISLSRTESGTPESKFAVVTSDEAYERALGLRPKRSHVR